MWSLPGYDVVELLASTATAEVWRGTDGATGEPVVLERFLVPTQPVALERLRREAALLTAFEHPHVVAVRAVLGSPEGIVVVLDEAPGRSLAEMLDTGGRLPAADVVAIAVPVAAALAAAHARELVHGRLSTSSVLTAPDGRPWLTDLGVAHLLAVARGEAATEGGGEDAVQRSRQPPTAPGSTRRSDDVRSLARVCFAALTGAALESSELGPGGGGTEGRDACERAVPAPDAPAGLVAFIASTLSADSAHCPSAAAFAAALRDSWPPSSPTDARPVPPPRLPGPASLPAAAAERRRLSRDSGGPVFTARRTPRLVVLPIAVVAAALLGWILARAGGPPTATRLALPAPRLPAAALPPGAPTLPTAPDPPGDDGVVPRFTADAAAWQRVIVALDAQRSAAFAAADPSALDAVYAPGAPGRATDEAAVHRLMTAGAHVPDLHHDVESVTVTAAAAEWVTLHVVDAMAAYDVLDRAGHVLAHQPERAAAAWQVVLVPAADGWRIAELQPA